MNEIVRIDNLSVIDSRRYLLRDISLSLNLGSSLTFIGESGSGKTMTIKSIWEFFLKIQRWRRGK